TNGKGDLEGQPTKPEAAASASESSASLANTDYVLFEALNLLRGMAIFNQAM
ncbi:MAG TPA: peptidase S41, partial [Gammaproteobacteria bacterium]|nr:peptidase S41 [Gammaproteobacteria bacterium]